MKERTTLVGAEQQEKDVSYYVRAGNLLIVEAGAGNGKTKFLRNIIEHFKGKIIYVNARKLTKTLDVEELLRKKKGFSGKVFGKKPKQMTLLLDNAEELSNVNIERLKNYFDQEYLHSVIFTTNDMKGCSFSESMENRIGRRIFKLKKPSKEDMKSIVQERLDENPDEDNSLITKKTIEDLHAKADSVNDMFVKLEHAFEKMDEEGAEQVTLEHLKNLPSKDDDTYKAIETKLSQEKKTLELKEDEENIVKVGSYYRNPEKEMFCSNCGAIVEEEDTSCPECAATFEDEEENKEEENTKDNTQAANKESTGESS